MNHFLSTLLRLSLLGSLLTGLLLLLRPLLRRWASRTASYYLWLLVLLRLCVPVGVTLSLPALPREAPEKIEAVKPDFVPPTLVSPGPYIPSSSPLTPVTPAPATVPMPVPAENTSSPDAPPLPEILLPVLWGLGVLGSLGWYIGGYLHFSRKVRKNALPPSQEALEVLRALDPGKRAALAECSLVSTPMLLGVLRPTIVLPKGVEGEGRLRDILTHELTHARRHDLLYKWFAALVTSLHWFNPVMPLVRREIARACELSCDEAVVRGMDDGARRHYGETLLALASAPAPGPGILAATLCEEKAQLKERLISIVNYRTKGAAAVLLSALLVLTVSGCALVSAASVSQPEEGKTPPASVVTPPSSQGGINPSQPLGTSPDSQDGTKSPVADSLPADFRSILRGQTGFVHITAEGYHWDRDIYSIAGTYAPYGAKLEVVSFAMADMDGDGAEELILQITAPAGDLGAFEILRRGEDGQIYGYNAQYKAISELKTDGSFSWTSPTGYEWGSCTLTFTTVGYERIFLTYGSEVPGEPSIYRVDGKDVSEEEYRAATEVQAAKPDAQWHAVPLDGEPEHSDMATLRGLDLDGDGLPDTVTALADWGRNAADSTTLRIDLGSSAVLEKTWDAGAMVHLLAAPLTASGRDAILLERGTPGSNYGAAEYHVLEVADGQLTESLTLDYDRQLELKLTLVSGAYLDPVLRVDPFDREASESFYTLRIPSLWNKWVGDIWQTFGWMGGEWIHAADDLVTMRQAPVVTGGRQLTLEVQPVKKDLTSTTYLEQVLVYDGNRLLQTITEDDVRRDSRYRFDDFIAEQLGTDFGWVFDGFLAWEFDVKDVNFDGAEDFGIITGSGYNRPTVWFVWDGAAEQFRFAFFSSGDLRVDDEKQQLVEGYKDGAAYHEYYVYEYNAQGERVQVDHYVEDWRS